MRRHSLIAIAAAGLGLLLTQCSGEQVGAPAGGPDRGAKAQADDEGRDASAEAVFLDFEFDGKMYVDYATEWNVQRQIQEHLRYTVGQLNGDNSVGTLNRTQLTNITISDAQVDYEGQPRAMKQVTYHAKMVVAWADSGSPPSGYQLELPRFMDSQGQSDFTDKFKHDCVDYGAHDVDVYSMWYYYRPNRSSCKIDAAKYLEPAWATVSQSAVQTHGKYPEYDKVWEDGALRIVAVFGKYEDFATTSDAGISGYNTFVGLVKKKLGSLGTLTTVPAQVPSNPGVGVPDITFNATLADGKTVEVVALLIDSVTNAGAAFPGRYSKLTKKADLIGYNGHSGLGQNIKAMANMGSWEAGQYAMVFLNGCDSYSYIDNALLAAHGPPLNPNDPEGTLHLDTVVNAMPSYFSSMPRAMMALVNGLLAYENPETYEEIFAAVDSSQVILVTGEHDNTFTPGGVTPPPPPETWGGLDVGETTIDKGDEAHTYDTPLLPAGSYVFEMTGTGDADLYMKVGAAPTFDDNDCGYVDGTTVETCRATLSAPARIFLMVNGWAETSSYKLVGRAE